MSFIFCPECGAPCSNTALQCPRCGFPVQYFVDWAPCAHCGTLCHIATPQCPKCGKLTLHEVDDALILPIPYNPFDEPGHYAYDYSNRWKPFRERYNPERVIAINPYLPPSLIEKLSQSPSDDVRSDIALNPSTPVSVLMRLLQDSSYFVKILVGQNPSTPTEVLAEIAAIDDEETRACVARNLNVTTEILDLLRTDKREDVMVAMADNPAIPEAYRASARQQLDDSWREAHADHHIHNYNDPYEGDEPMDDRYLPIIGADPESPLYEWHFDEDNGWLDYNPEE